ncbi:hypothetical protein [Pseudomonas mangiferae]|uniref:Uncharacterized protein n=1 Tax=Pseudomonas mangiferae TaxID=2593654 RepID=A0A553GZP6_9PSED|nr:hypothetical protein [Pseudomonas mangiferae]TRX74971.1 hypothetical protein FM069_10620 [Pseudomonas mangiferae]
MDAPELNESLNELAQNWLKRPLTEQERQHLLAFQRSLRDQTRQRDPAAQARRQAEETIEEGRQRTRDSIADVLRTVRQASSEALQAQQNGEQALLQAVEAASSLADLRPSNLNPGAPGGTSQIVMSQIADRLANLVKSEVQQCFEQNFGSLRRQLESALAVLQETNRSAGSPDPATAPNRRG